MLVKRFGRAKAAMKDKIRRMKHWPVEEEQQKRINAMLRGHFNYYGIAGNGRKLAAFWNFTRREWRHVLSKRSQKGRLTWEAFVALLEKTPLTPPKIRIQYADLAAYTRL
jgi:RNA-directed DNA polymerase